MNELELESLGVREATGAP